MLGRKEEGKRAVAIVGVLFLFFLLMPPVEGALQTNIYCIKSYKCYNGTDQGYIMSYTWETTNPRQSMRVALSVDRPAYEVGDSVEAMIRADGYFTRDSGWWYIVKNASIPYVTFYYPNGSVARNISGQATDSIGVWENKSTLFFDRTFPFGRYKVNASVRGPSAGAPGQAVSLSGLNLNGTNMTVYFDVGGELNVTMSSPPEMTKNNNISINGTVYQPNGQVFNSTYVRGVPGFNWYFVNITVIKPDTGVEGFAYNTTNGSYYLRYNATQLGTYYVSADVEYALGNQALRGRYSSGRVAQKFVVYGNWPEVGLGLSPTPLRSLIALLFAFYLRRGKHG